MDTITTMAFLDGPLIFQLNHLENYLKDYFTSIVLFSSNISAAWTILAFFLSLNKVYFISRAYNYSVTHFLLYYVTISRSFPFLLTVTQHELEEL